MMKLRKPDLGRRELVAGFSALVLLLALVIGVTNCGGGGGGGGGGDDDDTISGSTTYEEVAGDAPVSTSVNDDNGSEAASTSIDSYSMGTGTVGTGENIATGVSVQTAKKAEGLAASALEAYRRGQEQGLFSGSSNLAGVTESCPDGGDASTTWVTDGGDPGELDASGDEVEISFDNCQIDPIVYDGGITLNLNDDIASNGTLDLTMEFNNWLIGQDGEAITGADGALRFRTGTFAGPFPSEKGHSAFRRAGRETEIHITIGFDGGSLDMVDNTRDWATRITDLNFYMDDGGNDNDGNVNTSNTWYLMYHGDPASHELCSTAVGGCISLNHDNTTGFTFEGGNPYPTSGVLRIDGDDPTYVELDALGDNDDTFDLTIEDGNGPDTTTETWSDFGSF